MSRRTRTAAAIIIAVLAAVPAALAEQAPWWTHAVIYEIYPRSFQDTDGDGVGDLKGVTQRLDYLQELGIDAIWLTPFYPSPNADFGYDVADYTNVAPEYGTMADWDALVREANKRGIRILVDLVLNHSSDQHPWFKESRSSIDNPKRDWYIWRNGAAAGEPPTHWESIFGGYAWTLDPATQQWYYHIFLPQQPDLNWASPGLRQAMFEIVRFWLDHGAGGFRLDATPYLFEDPALPDDPDPKSGPPVWLKPYNSGRPENHGVLRDLRAILDGYSAERVLLGESATATIEDLAAVYGSRHDEINLPMDFLFGNLTHLDASVFKRQVDDAEFKLDGQPPVFFFSSHDHSRQWSSFGDGVHDDQIAKLTAALTLTPRGTALLYYGEEIGMGDMPATELQTFPLGPRRPRADERDRARTPMQWSAAAGAGFSQAAPWLPVGRQYKTYNVAGERRDPQSIYRWYAKLLRLRRDNPAFRTGAYVPLDSANPQIFAFARRSGDGNGALVVFNTSPEPQRVSITGWPGSPPVLQRVLMASPAASVRPGHELKLAPFGVLIVALAAAPRSRSGTTGVADPIDALDAYRPQLHFSPARHWINDPNGLVYLDGEYHLFYQYNPFGDQWGHMSWGHAVSSDLVHWRELPVAIPEDSEYSIFSGSVVVDYLNTSGFGTPGHAPLVAVYTGAQRSAVGIQSQQLAYSRDAGETWTKYRGNPVLDLGLRNFRDPKVFWYEPDGRWVMVTVLSEQHKVAFFGSKDLKTWEHLSDFGPAGAADGAWECPDLFALPVKNFSGDVRWVLKMDVFRSKVAAGSGAQYFVGNFDGQSFVEEAGTGAQSVDFGRDFYAAASWANLPARDGRHVWIAWMNNHAYARDIPTGPFRGTMSLPREVSLRRADGGYELLQTPIAELARLRAHHRRLTDIRVTDRADAISLSPALGAASEIELTLQAGSASEFGLLVRTGENESTVIGYDVISRQLFIDRTRSGRVDFNEEFAGRHSAPLSLTGGSLKLHVLLDRSSVEVFAGDGERVLTDQIFPAAGSARLLAYARGGTATVRQADLWDLAPSRR